MAGRPDTQIDDEQWLSDYLEFGWAELVSYLAKWAAFARWCVTNNREEA